ncbi:MAG: DUF1003 domain-containing protein [Saprospiraceae bacterium]|nr:DUF1003 domain-containing protein [Saprospiraceae bacterium]
MKDNMIKKYDSIESKQIEKLHQIVDQTIKEEELILNNLLYPPQEMITPGQKISDKVARFGGSWTFIIFFIIVLFLWILFNSLVIAGLKFDPYPFILMNLILSCIAALQAPIIMMSQNRQEEKDRKRAENDYLVNLKAEIEIRGLNQKVDLLLEEQIQTLNKIQEQQLAILAEILHYVKKE